ncbi:MAG TPA: T9SS type A sorting domain-containing protein, partial [Bacteroidia bacterium]|nr:T9SS type A sorting domain-containing protein [Bacteroidia bacterium]
TSLLTYTLNDPDVTKGIYYYRLRQMDFDGRYTQSGIVAVTIDDNIAMLTVTPNPTQNTSELSFESAAPGLAELKIYDTRGRLVLSKELDCTKGRNSYMLDLNKEISGMFYIILKLGDSSYSTKLLKQ